MIIIILFNKIPRATIGPFRLERGIWMSPPPTPAQSGKKSWEMLVKCGKFRNSEKEKKIKGRTRRKRRHKAPTCQY